MTQTELDALANAISRNLMCVQKEILSLDEVVEYTGLSKSFLYKLTSNRVIPHYKPSGKLCYFRKAEIDQWLTSNPVATSAELEAKALHYCRTHKLPN